LLRETFDHDEPEMWRRQAIYAKAVFASDDAREGRQAFAEKRAPVWRGR
jgi:enoyl-CoA hydratase